MGMLHEYSRQEREIITGLTAEEEARLEEELTLKERMRDKHQEGLQKAYERCYADSASD